MRRSLRALPLIAVVVGLAGCTLRLSQVREDSVVDASRYEAIQLGRDRRRDVLASLGPPDRVLYGRSILVFDYLWKRHRSTDMRLFVPSEVIPGLDPLALLSIPRFFFDPSEDPEEFETGHMQRFAEGIAGLATSFVPFGDGTDLLIARGYQLRSDRVRIVFDRTDLIAEAKSLRYASGEYRSESLTDRILLRAN